MWMWCERGVRGTVSVVRGGPERHQVCMRVEREMEGRIREMEKLSRVYYFTYLIWRSLPIFFLFFLFTLPSYFVDSHHRRLSLLPRCLSGGEGIALLFAPPFSSSLTTSRRGSMDFFVSCIITIVTNYYHYHCCCCCCCSLVSIWDSWKGRGEGFIPMRAEANLRLWRIWSRVITRLAGVWFFFSEIGCCGV